MFNLLPESLKQKIKSEYRIRLLVVALIFVLFVQVSFLILIFPSWLSSFYKEQEVSGEVEMAKGSELSSDVSSTTIAVQSINAELNIIDAELEYPRVIPFIDTILSQRTSDIYINGLTYVSTDKNAATITLMGISDTRQSLVAFVERLKQIKSFVAVDLPISNLVKDQNINFSLTITITQ